MTNEKSEMKNGKSVVRLINKDSRDFSNPTELGMSPNKGSRRNFLRTGSIAALGAFASPGIARTSQRNHSLNLYVGTYTSGKSEGIYIYRMNLDTGELKRLNTMKAVNPSFLAIDASKRH